MKITDKQFRFIFEVTLLGTGRTLEEAWKSVTDEFELDPECPAEVRAVEDIEEEE